MNYLLYRDGENALRSKWYLLGLAHYSKTCMLFLHCKQFLFIIASAQHIYSRHDPGRELLKCSPKLDLGSFSTLRAVLRARHLGVDATRTNNYIPVLLAFTKESMFPDDHNAIIPLCQLQRCEQWTIAQNLCCLLITQASLASIIEEK